MSTYASLGDLENYVGTANLATYEQREDTGSAQELLDEAEGRVNSYLGRFKLPPSGPVPDLKRALKNIAGYDLMSSLGYQSEGEGKLFRERFLDEIKWLEQVAAGKLTPPGLETPLPPANDPFVGTGFYVSSDQPRGW